MVFPPRFVWNWPSLVTEIISGLVCILIALPIIASGHAITRHPFPTSIHFIVEVLLLTGVMSWYYEKYRDANGWSWKDVGQRQIGIVLGIIFMLFLI